MKQKTRAGNYKTWICRMIGIFFVVYPFITFFHLEKLAGNSYYYFQNTEGYVADFFLYHKEVCLILLAGFLICFYIGEHIFPDHVIKNTSIERKAFRRILVLVAVYAVLILLSMVRSVAEGYGDTTLWGICTEYEGGLALLAYLVLFLAGCQYFEREDAIQILMKCLDVLMALIGILVFVEYAYQPIYQIGFMKYLIAPAEYRQVAESLENTQFVGQASLAFYNPGYLGGMAALLFPISVGRLMEEKRKEIRVLRALVSAGMFFAVLASNSSGALYAALFSLVGLAVLYRREWKRGLTNLGMLAVGFAAVFLITDLCSDHLLTEKARKTFFHEETLAVSTDVFDLQGLEIVDGNLKIKSTEHTYELRPFVMNEGKTVQFLLFEGDAVIEESGDLTSGMRWNTEDGDICLAITDGILVIDFGFEEGVDFYLEDGEFRLIGQNGTLLSKIPETPIKGMEEFYSIATGRGYIWVNTLPILKKTMILGTGPGTFVFEFVQNDVVGLLKSQGNTDVVVDKPHNWYLQVAVNTGVISLLLLVSLVLILVRRMIKQDAGLFEWAMLIGVLAFCLVGLVNDSSVTVNPFFWLLLGVGYARTAEEKG